MPKAVEFKVGDKVYLRGDHPYAGEVGEVIALQMVMGRLRPRVKIPSLGDHEVFVMQDNQAKVVE